MAADGVWRASNTPEGPVTLHLRAGNHEVEAEAWGAGADWALDQAGRLIGDLDDRSGFHPDRHPVVADLDRRFAGLRLARSDRVVEALIPAVLGQKVTGAESKESYRRLVWSHGEPAPGPIPLRLPPTPSRLAELGYHDFHPLGVERRRADTILRVCRRATELDRLASPPSGPGGPERVSTRLRAVPGIGPWTAGLVCLAALGHADAVPLGDFNLPSRVAWSLAGERTAGDVRMLELLEPFAGHRGRVLRLIKAGTPKPPRRAARRRLRSIASL